MKTWLVLAALTSLATRVEAQRRPVIPQPTIPSGVSGTVGRGTQPVQPVQRRLEPASRAERSDTTEILEAVARKLSLNSRDMQDAMLSIQKDTAWVTLTERPFPRPTVRVERHNTWKVVDPE